MLLVARSSSSMSRQERIKSLRIKMFAHRRMARQNAIVKGPYHFDTVYQWDIVEELSAKLADEIYLMKMEEEAKKGDTYDGWDDKVMDRSYDV